MMTKKSKQKANSAPVKACAFIREDCVTFAEGAGKEENKNIKIVAYSGGFITDHWYWGNLAIDLNGLKFDKKKTPILQEHIRTDRVGFSTKQEITDQVVLEGPFLSNPIAAEIREDLADGFPMQASMYVPPDVIEYVGDGASVVVNGKTLKGPGTVFRQARIREVSVCTLGADGNTKCEAFSNSNDEIKFSVKENTNMETTETKKLTAELLLAENPDLHRELFDLGIAEGQKTEREIFSELKEVCGEDSELLVHCFGEKMDKAQALQARNDKLKKQLDESEKKRADLAAANATETPAPKKKVDPANTEFSDGTDPEGAGDEPTTDDELEAEFKKSKSLQNEFGELKYYLAYMKANADGRVTINERK